MRSYSDSCLLLMIATKTHLFLLFLRNLVLKIHPNRTNFLSNRGDVDDEKRERKREKLMPLPMLFSDCRNRQVLLPYHFQLHRLCRFERNAVDGLSLGVVGHRRIDLSCRDVLVAEHVLDGIDTCASIHL